MKRSALLASTGAALLLCATQVSAQVQQKGSDDKPAPSQVQREPGQQKEQAPQSKEKTARDKAGRKEKGTPQGKSQDQPGKGTAQTDPKDKATKGTAGKTTEPKDKATKGAAEKSTQPKDKATTGTAEKSTEPKDRAAGAEPKDKPGAAARVQLSEEQRTNVHKTILKDTNVNRGTNVNFSINVGTRVPRSVRLMALPASVIVIVPQYRSYHYVAVNDQICIVDPNSYEIVEVITVSGQTAVRDDRGGSARLVLTEEERMITLSEVDMSGGSTLGLGALTEGGDVPRDVKVRVFADTVVGKVPKLKGYKFFTAENRLVIVDPQGVKVQLVIEGRR